MTFLTPLAFLFLAAIPILIVFYLFRPEPQKRASSTFFLWKSSSPDSLGGRFAKRLQNNPLLWLQVLLVLCLVAFLARPSTPLKTSLPQSNRTIILLDRSASMAAGRSFQQALEIASEAVDGALGFQLGGSSKEIMLVALDDKASVLVPFTSDRTLLHEALAKLQVTDLEDQLETFRPFVKSLIKAHGAKVWLIGDRLPEELKISGLQFTSVAQDSLEDNAGILSFSVQRSQQGHRRPLLFARVENFSSTAQQRVLRLERLNSKKPEQVEGVVLEKRILLAASSGQTINETIPASGLELDSSTAFRLSLLPPANSTSDAFQTDDIAFCLLPPFRQDKLRVAVAPDVKATFLLKALAAAAPMELVSLRELLTGTDEAAVLIAGPGYAIPHDLPARSVFRIAPPSQENDSKVERLQALDSSLVKDSGVEWGRLSVELSDRSQLQQNEIVLLRTASGPALTLRNQEKGIPTLVWRFRLSHSSLPLSTALPVIVGRFVDQYSRSNSLTLAGSISTQTQLSRPSGQIWSGELLITGISGRAYEFQTQHSLSASEGKFSKPNHIGIYQLQTRENETQTPVAVNLYSHKESSLPHSLNDAQFDSESSPSAPQTALPSDELQYREFGLPFLIVALFLLFAEAGLLLRRGRP